VKQKKKIISRLKIISQYGVSQLLAVFSILLVSLIIVRFHSVELWGEYAELLIWSNFFLLFLSFGNHDFLLKEFSKSPSTINQQWTSNLIARSILLIPSFLLIYFIPIFNSLEFLIFILILLQFFNQSFKVLIVYHRKFNYTIWVEIGFNICLFAIIFFTLETIDLKGLIIAIIIAQALKLIGYSFLLKGFNNIRYHFQFDELKRAAPFFVPLAVGTIRVKVDAYYGTHFFNVSDLSKYQIFISFLALAQMSSSFAITPYLKNYYRSSTSLINKIQRRFFAFGWLFAIAIVVFMYLIISFVYGLDFSINQYILAFIFIIPLFLHVLLVSEYYKKDEQNKIALFASIIVLFQIGLGYFLINKWHINGALILKVLGQWGIVIILWLWIRNKKNE